MRRALQLGTVLALLVCVLVAAQIYVVGSYWGNWLYGYAHPFTLLPIGVAALVTAIASVALAFSVERVRTHEWIVVVGWLLLAFALQALLRTVAPVTLKRIFMSSGANSFYDVTLRYPPSAVLGDFNRLRRDWPLHAQSNMPGKILVIHALERFTNRTSILAAMVVVLSNLGGVLLYLFVRDLLDDRRVALFSLILYALVPGKLFFFPLMNTLTPTLAFSCAWLVLRWVQTARPLYAVLTGIALFALTIFEPLPLVMGVLFLTLVGLAIEKRTITRPQVAWHLGAGALAFAVTYAIVLMTTGFELVGAFRMLGAEARAFNVEAHRRYLVWVVMNVTDFAFAIGICQAVLFTALFAMSMRGDVPQPMRALCLALGAILAVTDVLGVNRGEVVRLWIFLACFFQIPVAYACARLDAHRAMTIVIGLTALQGALGLSMIGFVSP